ncbi:MAG: hypothetical protein RLP12_00900 [Ekhidna sp.]
MRQLILAWLACSATNILVGVLFHRFVIGEQIVAWYEQLGSQPTPVLALGTHLVISTVMVYLYPKFYKGGSAALEGYRLGVAVGVLTIAPIAFVFLVMKISIWTIVVDVLWHILIEEPLTGVVIGLVYRGLDHRLLSERTTDRKEAI